jgi:tetratricopeptide (TPR) repeat protein
VVQLDGESTSARVRLAAFCVEIGRKDEATQLYVEAAQLALHRGDLAAAQAASKKLQELDPNNPQTYLLRAREALATGHPEEVEAILSAIPELKDNPTARSLLVDSYLPTQQLEKAEKLMPEIFRANPTDFTPVASFVSACVQVNEFDTAFRPLSALADELIRQGNTSSLVESLRLIWNKSPQHLPVLELIYRIYDERGEEYALTETLEALSQAYLQAEQFEKAEQAVQRLVSREPTNERYQALMKQVLKKQGKEIGQASVAGPGSPASELTQVEGSAAPASPAAAEAERAAAVKQALENSELFVRYNLVRKAVAELDKVLEIYPDEPEIHRRLVGMCWKVMPERAEQAAQALVRVYTKQGDSEGAKRFEQMVSGREAPAAEAVPPQAVRASVQRLESLPPPSAQPAPAAPREVAVASGFSSSAVRAPESAPTPSVSAMASGGATFDLSGLASPAPPPAPTSEIREVDLSEDWEYFQGQAASAWLASKTPQQATSFDYEEARIEINFYLENGFLEEAIKAVEELERVYPGEPRIAEFRTLVDAHAAAMAAELPARQPAESSQPSFVAAVAPPAEGLVEGLGVASGSPAPKPEAQAATMPPISPGEEGIPRPARLSATRRGALAETLQQTASFDYEDSCTEINFYLENGFLEEAIKAVEELERAHPGEARIAELRALVEAHAGARATELPEKQPTESLQPTFVATVAPPAKGSVEASGVASGSPALKPGAHAVPAPPISPGEEEAGTSAPLSTRARATTNPLGELADAFGPAIGELAELSPPPAAPSAPTAGSASVSGAPTSAPASPLGGLLEEMGEALTTEPDEEEDPETHYNLGVAFREMHLLDEAIGEFQKVVKGAGKSPHSPKYLQACSLLATCFMDKGMASVAIKWYCRALETPDLDEEALLALQYDLGVAYEQAGDARHALEKYTEVYGQNIDFRDVAEKIRIIQQKVS